MSLCIDRVIQASGPTGSSTGSAMVDGNKAPDVPERAGPSPTPIVVGIGASAGGVQALQTFFEAVPDHTGASFVVILHLDPQYRSDLAQILGAHTQMPVVQVQTRQKFRPDHKIEIGRASCRERE